MHSSKKKNGKKCAENEREKGGNSEKNGHLQQNKISPGKFISAVPECLRGANFNPLPPRARAKGGGSLTQIGTAPRLGTNIKSPFTNTFSLLPCHSFCYIL
jgi:hypothetical protein